jgi:hypothetical protein
VNRDPAVVRRGQQRSGRDTMREWDLSRVENVVRELLLHMASMYRNSNLINTAPDARIRA